MPSSQEHSLLFISHSTPIQRHTVTFSISWIFQLFSCHTCNQLPSSFRSTPNHFAFKPISIARIFCTSLHMYKTQLSLKSFTVREERALCMVLNPSTYLDGLCVLCSLIIFVHCGQIGIKIIVLVLSRSKARGKTQKKNWET